ncbi:hypothetical protein F5876DRAFT_81398 [Lentinula aff. lateritia]|uniref:Uncharacterized protein n=1 Tax=Lentinula aff. lateritia TaxID=2804960 RepID=A0ACC1TM40_9AGAR|nr:hypothetical protein F5876DRAFT_81398 [Lentinula aff. lateritia]
MNFRRQGLSGKDDDDDTTKQKTELEQDGTTSEPLSLWTVEFDCLVWILYNMTGDKNFEYPWWTPVTKHHEQYRSFASTAARLKLWLRRITKNDLDDFVFQHVVGIIRHDILTACEGLQALYASQSSWSLADHRQFLDLFSLGPGGLDLVVECLQILYDEFQVVDLGILARLARDYTDVYEGVRHLPQMLLSLVHLFRAKNSRSLWDPKDGFSEFLIILGKYRGQLPISAPKSKFHSDLSHLDLHGFSVYDIHETLVQAFGSVHDSAKLHPDVLCSGEHGLDGFHSNFITVLLDSMDTTRREYKKIYDLFGGLCQAIADRLVFDFARRTSCPPTASASSSSTAEPAPSASSSSAAKPAPSAAVPTYSARVKAAQTFAKRVSGFTWANFLQDLLRDWPHPQLSKRIDIASFRKLPLQKQYRKLYLVYHPDANVKESSDWKMITSILAQAIGTARSNN